jgi:transcription initiation factor TFIIB
MERSDREALLDGLTDIDHFIDEIGADTNVKQRATEIYRNSIQEGSILSGRGTENVAAGSVLLAARESDSICTADDIAEHASDHIQGKTIIRCTKQMRNRLDIGFILADPHKYIDEIAGELDAPDEHTDLAHRMVDYLIEDGITSGNKAGAVAGSTFYIVGVITNHTHGQGQYTQEEVAAASDVTTVTIRNNYQKYAKVLATSDDFGIPSTVTEA